MFDFWLLVLYTAMVIAVVLLGSWMLNAAKHSARRREALKNQILGSLASGKAKGEELSKRLSISSVEFYAIMAELEDAGLARGWYVETEIDGVKIKQRWHERIT